MYVHTTIFMELIPTIHRTWKLCTFWTFVLFFVIILCLNNQPEQNLSFFVLRRPQPPPQPQTVSSDLAPLDLDSYSHPAVNSNVTKAPEPTSELDPGPRNFTVEVQEERREKISIDRVVVVSESNTTTTYPVEFQQGREVPESSEKGKRCNVFDDGRWVYRPEEVAPYNSSVCPFLEEKVSCQKNGRPDSDYEKWRWEAPGCDIPVFDGIYMLEKLRNKRVIIVGDSLNRNQWQSLACLLYSKISPSRAEVDAADALYKVFKAKDYNFILEFYWSPFLVKLDEHHESGRKVLVLDKLSANSEKWHGADVMVFNSGHWWTHPGKLKSWDVFEYEGKVVEDIPLELAYERGMKTWATWIESNVDTKKTTVFFRSISPEHMGGSHWCYNSTQPIMDESYKSPYSKALIDVIERLMITLRSRVKYLNITKISEYRKDAHPSLYRTGKWKIYIEKYQNLIPSYADCSHWCLPGVPDTWNRFLYASLFFDTSGDMSSNFPTNHTNAENIVIDHTSPETVTDNHIEKVENKTHNSCNIFDGRWVYRPDQVPSYDAQCRLIDKKANCRMNGRTNLEYEKWRWEARDCDIPLFNGTSFLERLRDKRMIIVGDSISRSHYVSLICLLYSSIPPSTTEIKSHDGWMVFKAKDYNSTIEFYWSAFLVELNKTHESGRRVLMLDKMTSLSEKWRGAHVMMFNSGFWWMHPVEVRGWDLFQYKGQLIEKMRIEVAFDRAMKTWAKWMEQNVDPKQTTVFYRSMSAEHYGKQWCYKSNQPMIMNVSAYESRFPMTMIKTVEKLVKRLSKLQVRYFDITTLSEYRSDAHPSIYKNTEWKNKKEWKQGMLPRPNTDCSHWCLPGLPDTWNRLLYASLLFDGPGDTSSF